MAGELEGNASIAKVVAAGGGATNEVLNGLDATLTLSRDIIESTNKSSSQWKRRLYGNGEAQLSASGVLDSSAGGDATGLIVLESAYLNMTKLDVEFVESGTARTWSFQGVLQDLPKTYPQNDAQAYSFTLLSDGAVSVA